MGMTDADRILETQRGILVEVDRGRRYRVGTDGLIHFRIRNLTRSRGHVTMRLQIPRVNLHRDEASILLQPGSVQDLRFAVFYDTPGEKLIESLEVQFELGGRPGHLVLPDHALTFEVSAAGDEHGGRIDLRGATFDFRDHIGDVDLRDLIQRQDLEFPALAEEDWTALALIPRSQGRVIVKGYRRKGLRDLVLKGPPSYRGHERRIFLFARRDLPFGVVPRLGDLEIPLVLRHLPDHHGAGEHDREDPNDYLSRLHGRIALHATGLAIRDEDSTNGISLNGRTIPPGMWEALPTEIQIRLTAGEPVLHLAGRICNVHGQERRLTLDWTASEKVGSTLDVGAEHPHSVDAFRLVRLDNAEEHHYVQVFRMASVGSDPDAAIPVDGPQIAPWHAEIVFYRGEWFVHSLTASSPTEVDGSPVGADEYLALAPGKVLTLGSTDYRVQETTLAQMTKL